jgi:hypothetical protein
MRRNGPADVEDSRVRLVEADDVVVDAELGIALTDLPSLQQLVIDPTAVHRLRVTPQLHLTLAAPLSEIEPAGLVHELHPAGLLDDLERVVGGLGQRCVYPRVVRVADDPRVILRSTLVVPKSELLQRENLTATQARQPVGSGTSDPAAADNHKTELSRHAPPPRLTSRAVYARCLSASVRFVPAAQTGRPAT